MSVDSLKSIFDWVALIGVFVTLTAGIGAVWTGNIINDRQGERLRKFDSGLTVAKSDLAAQQERAALAEGKIALAEQHTTEARGDIAKANELAEKERLARVKIEANVAWRHLSDKQVTDIARRLHNLHSREAITVWFSAGDAEGARFAADIAEMLREGKMFVYPPRPLAPPTPETVSITDPIKPYETGVLVESTNDPASRSLAEGIVEELRNAGFDAKTVESDAPAAVAKDIGLPNIVVGVAGRPNGPQGEYNLEAEKEAVGKNKHTQNSQRAKP